MSLLTQKLLQTETPHHPVEVIFSDGGLQPQFPF